MKKNVDDNFLKWRRYKCICISIYVYINIIFLLFYSRLRRQFAFPIFHLSPTEPKDRVWKGWKIIKWSKEKQTIFQALNQTNIFICFLWNVLIRMFANGTLSFILATLNIRMSLNDIPAHGGTALLIIGDFPSLFSF